MSDRGDSVDQAAHPQSLKIKLKRPLCLTYRNNSYMTLYFYLVSASLIEVVFKRAQVQIPSFFHCPCSKIHVDTICRYLNGATCLNKAFKCLLLGEIHHLKLTEIQKCTSSLEVVQC